MTDTIEASRLRELEGIIERGLQTFAAVGVALLEIREQKLYRGTHKTFETYLRDRWDISRSYAHRTIEAAQIVEMLPMGNKPTSERIARELAPLKDDPEAMAATWEQVTVLHSQPTAKDVREVVVEVTRDETPPREIHVTVVAPEADDEWAKADWQRLQSALDMVRDLSADPVARFAGSVPERNRAGTAKRLRVLGRYLGAIAVQLEDMGRHLPPTQEGDEPPRGHAT